MVVTPTYACTCIRGVGSASNSGKRVSPFIEPNQVQPFIGKKMEHTWRSLFLWALLKRFLLTSLNFSIIQSYLQLRSPEPKNPMENMFLLAQKPLLWWKQRKSKRRSRKLKSYRKKEREEKRAGEYSKSGILKRRQNFDKSKVLKGRSVQGVASSKIVLQTMDYSLPKYLRMSVLPAWEHIKKVWLYRLTFEPYSGDVAIGSYKSMELKWSNIGSLHYRKYYGKCVIPSIG